MEASARGEIDCIFVWKIDRFSRSVLRLSQQLAALTSYGVRFIAVSQAIDTEASNRSSRLMLAIFWVVAELEREIIRELSISGIPFPTSKPRKKLELYLAHVLRS